MTDQGRITLAEAMGWRWVENQGNAGGGRWYKPDGDYLDFVSAKWRMPFSPFTDANDDYAVLEWMRENLTERVVAEYPGTKWELELESIQDAPSNPFFNSWCQYQVGDYARAALKVIETTEGSDQ